MAHFAEINSSNVVQRCIVVSNEDVVANGGEYSTAVEAWVKTKFGGHAWIQCSYNKNQRGEFPGPGWNWSPTKEKFYPKRPIDCHGNSCDSWTLNADTLEWTPPTVQPGNSARAYTEDGIEKMMVVRWDETAGKWRSCKDDEFGACVSEWYWNTSTNDWDEIT